MIRASILVLGLVLGLVLAAASCSVDHRSGAFQCTKQSDCNSGRICINSYCIFAGLPVDAPVKVDAPNPDATTCPVQCTSCDLNASTCTIDCSASDCTGAAPIVCPADWNCEVSCSTADSCNSGVICSGPSCTIQCTGPNSCREVSCGLGRCTIGCTGIDSCQRVQCGTACVCDVECAATSDCGTVMCTKPSCKSGDGCSSQMMGCDSCP
jgi:hypothetical protein